eukprot:g6363.t1
MKSTLNKTSAPTGATPARRTAQQKNHKKPATKGKATTKSAVPPKTKASAPSKCKKLAAAGEEQLSNPVKLPPVEDVNEHVKQFLQLTKKVDKDMTVHRLSTAISNWYKSNRRDLPWRKQPEDAYKVLVSEIMLQQTRVAAVIPYWTRWTHTWPDVKSLAEETNMDRVLEHWAGLGYYNRARNLKKIAETTVGELQSINLPNSREKLRALPGIGPYTASAVASISYGERVGTVDGNVQRVMYRVFHVNDRVLPTNEKQAFC